MAVRVANDLDFLAARLHGRRSQLAEGQRLDELCRIRTVDELARRVYPDLRIRNASGLQRQMIRALLEELGAIADGLSGAGRDWFLWQRVRFQVENLKVLARGAARELSATALQPHLIDLPPDLALDGAAWAEPPGTASLAERLARTSPAAPLRDALLDLKTADWSQSGTFLLETALDRAFLREALCRTGSLPGADRDAVLRIARHEIDSFNILLLVRGRHHYRVPAERLEPLLLPDGSLDSARFEQFLQADDLPSGWPALTRLPFPGTDADDAASLLETGCWNRYLHIANAMFRSRHMTLGAAIGYAAIRRIELANLITLAEGMRLGLDPRMLRQRLIPRTVAGEVQHV